MLASPPVALVSDVDGTLSPIVAHPGEASLASGVRDGLDAIRPRLALVAFVSGRAAADVRLVTGDSSALVVGNHGAEWLEPGARDASLAPELEPLPATIAWVVGALERELAALEGVDIEAKGPSATIHYRNAPNSDLASEAVRAAVAALPLPEVLEARDGRMSVELRARGVDKGTALRAIVERHGLRGVLLFGDDRTDADAFRAARALREVGAIDAFIGAVGAGGEVPHEVVDAADAVIESPAAVGELLLALARS